MNVMIMPRVFKACFISTLGYIVSLLCTAEFYISKLVPENTELLTKFINHFLFHFFLYDANNIFFLVTSLRFFKKSQQVLINW